MRPKDHSPGSTRQRHKASAHPRNPKCKHMLETMVSNMLQELMSLRQLAPPTDTWEILGNSPFESEERCSLEKELGSYFQGGRRMCRFNFSARSPAPEKWNSLRHGVTPPAHPAPSRWFDSRVRVDMVRVHLGLSGVLKMIILA